jgi:hypothetical protein
MSTKFWADFNQILKLWPIVNVHLTLAAGGTAHLIWQASGLTRQAQQLLTG